MMHLEVRAFEPIIGQLLRKRSEYQSQNMREPTHVFIGRQQAAEMAAHVRNQFFDAIQAGSFMLFWLANDSAPGYLKFMGMEVIKVAAVDYLGVGEVHK